MLRNGFKCLFLNLDTSNHLTIVAVFFKILGARALPILVCKEHLHIITIAKKWLIIISPPTLLTSNRLRSTRTVWLWEGVGGANWEPTVTPTRGRRSRLAPREQSSWSCTIVDKNVIFISKHLFIASWRAGHHLENFTMSFFKILSKLSKIFPLKKGTMKLYQIAYITPYFW